MRYFNLQEAAHFLGVDWRTVRAQVLAGRLRGFRFGRQWRISEADLAKFISDATPVGTKG